GAKSVVNLSNIDQVYDEDPRKNGNAIPIDKVSWPKFRKIVGDEWIPGMNSPFDPVAAKKAEELGIKVVIMNGKDFENIERYFKGEDFVGTTVE
ncbi:MAG: UMP kinase, partial [Patescibacteria group bacterium]